MVHKNLSVAQYIKDLSGQGKYERALMERLDDPYRRERKWLVKLPTIIFIIVIIASLILGGFASIRASQNQASTANTQVGQSESVYVVVVISGNTTYTTTITKNLCTTGQVEVIVQPIVVAKTDQTITTTTTYTTTKC